MNGIIFSLEKIFRKNNSAPFSLFNLGHPALNDSVNLEAYKLLVWLLSLW